jgi:hypothetical protein
MLSPDGSWLVSEASESDTIWKPRWERNADSVNESWFGLVVTDLQRLRRSIVIEPRPFKGVRPTPSEDAPPPRSDSLKFLGWNVDSDRFYLIYFPVGLPVYELPAGLLVMNPKNGYIEAVVPAVVFGLISPDHEHVFLVTAETIQENRATGMKAAIYRLDGTPITALQPLSASIEYDVLNEMDIYSSNATRLISSEWSPDGTQLVYADTGGNIWVMDTTGNTTLLTANLPKESWDGKAIFSWSPDGQYLLIKSKEYAWIADFSAGQRFPGAMKYYYCSTLVEGSEGTRESPYDCGNDVKVSNVVEIVCKQGGGTLYVHHAGMTSNFYEVLLISPNCQVQKKGEFEGSPPSH